MDDIRKESLQGLKIEIPQFNICLTSKIANTPFKSPTSLNLTTPFDAGHKSVSDRSTNWFPIGPRTCFRQVHKPVSDWSTNKSGYRGGDRGVSPPLSNFRGGLSPPEDCPPPEQFRGGGRKNVHPLSDSGGGQRFFFRYFLVNSFCKQCKILGEYKNFRALRARMGT